MPEFRFIKTVVYKLKRRYGQLIVLTRITTKGTVNYTTGESSGRVSDIKTVKQAVILPSRQLRQISYGGFYDVSQRDVLIANKDLGSFTITQDTTVLYNDEKYEIKELQEYPDIRAWYFIIVRVKGDRT